MIIGVNDLYISFVVQWIVAFFVDEINASRTQLKRIFGCYSEKITCSRIRPWLMPIIVCLSLQISSRTLTEILVICQFKQDLQYVNAAVQLIEVVLCLSGLICVVQYIFQRFLRERKKSTSLTSTTLLCHAGPNFPVILRRINAPGNPNRKRQAHTIGKHTHSQSHTVSVFVAIVRYFMSFSLSPQSTRVVARRALAVWKVQNVQRAPAICTTWWKLARGRDFVDN